MYLNTNIYVIVFLNFTRYFKFPQIFDMDLHKIMCSLKYSSYIMFGMRSTQYGLFQYIDLTLFSNVKQYQTKFCAHKFAYGETVEKLFTIIMRVTKITLMHILIIKKKYICKIKK